MENARMQQQLELLVMQCWRDFTGAALTPMPRIGNTVEVLDERGRVIAARDNAIKREPA
jgi:hypothetical protein